MSYQHLISTQQLLSHLGEENWLVFDCRFDLADVEKGRRDYHQSHIPGAFYAHLDEQLSAPITPQSGRHPLPDIPALCSWLGECGLQSDKQVVVYDDSGGAMAVRLWWLLKGLGHDAVALLDGGWSQWQQQGLVCDDHIVKGTPADFSADFDDKLVVTTQQLVDNLASGGLQLVDVRAVERFNGEAEPIDPVAGHIPGALNIPLTQNLNERGCFKPAAELRALYQPLMQQCDSSRQVYMCGSGVTACHSLLALTIAGYPMPRLYAGSWSEWIRDAGRPVAGRVDEER